MKGTKSTATNSDIAKIKEIAQGKLNRKSCTNPTVIIRNGKNVMLIASVADKIDLKKCIVLYIEACQRDIPSDKRSK